MIDEKEIRPEEVSPEAETPETVESEAPAASEAPESEAPAAEEEKGGRRDKKAAQEIKKLRAENTELAAALKAAQEDAEAQKDKYVRTYAEYENYRKRSSKEREGIYADAKADCVSMLLPLFDNLERASAFTEGGEAAEGVRMILASVPEILAKLGVTSFGALGDTFDPALHNAVMHVEDEEHGEGEIVEVFQVGYRHGDRVIRYAMVKVAN